MQAQTRCPPARLGELDVPRSHCAPDTLRQQWYRGGPVVDADIKAKFGSDLEAAEAGRLAHWSSGYPGLAHVLLLDQFTRCCADVVV